MNYQKIIYPNYIPDGRIRRLVEELLFNFNGKSIAEQTLPIPVEEIAEFHLGYSLNLDHLGDRFGFQDTFGFIDFDRKEIWIDSSLEPGVSPTGNEGRYLFTVSHEIGHDQLHRPFYDNRHIQKSLFDSEQPVDNDQPDAAIMCREKEKREPQEIQADLFASELLMPEVLIRQQFHEITNEIRRNPNRWAVEMMVTDELCRRFHTSKQAMEIRLDKLKLWHGLQGNRLILT